MSFSCNSTNDEFTTDQGTFENVIPTVDEELQWLSTEMECVQKMPSQNENENLAAAPFSDEQGNSKNKMINTQPCFAYIDKNADTLIKSEEFLQIDQKLLCKILETENRRAMLGPALFKIRFPLISKEEFSTKIFPLGVLTPDEVISIYQFHCYTNNLCGPSNSMPFAGVPMPFPTHGRISDRKKGTLMLNIEKVSEFVREADWSSRHSEVVYIMALQWGILAQIRTESGSSEKCLGFILCCIDPNNDSNWICRGSATFRVLSKKIGGATNFTRTLNDFVINNEHKAIGFCLPFAELMNPSKGLYNKNEDKLTLAIDVTLKEAEAMDKKASAAEQNNSFGTISMEIEKVSEFSRENLYSNRTSETVYLKGFPWQIMADINPNPNGVSSTDGSTELYLGFYLWCTSLKRENWSCKCSATVRIVSQMGAGWDFSRREFARDTVFNNSLTTYGFSNFIAFSELMDPAKGLYNTKEDKVTLAIDFTVTEAKTDKCV
ncbi:hypothetical protein niasHT_037382 [Heterodera trifolii]|uniref:MATH domain-containing protein n=1 Tax=Heterodera trifolii TaxID=157864 RepID=A0ABD2J246_9BILA